MVKSIAKENSIKVEIIDWTPILKLLAPMVFLTPISFKLLSICEYCYKQKIIFVVTEALKLLNRNGYG